ncbi:MAG: TauD/TfdA family dioxygenase, partial [Rubrivivax sp.]|nr:TauD/TfdA family dioxygenase [Rubrivivax sp.]
MHTTLLAPPPARTASPFDLDDEVSYGRWRAWKLANRPLNTAALTVGIVDPRALQPAERSALLTVIERTSFAVYRSPLTTEDKDIARRLGAQLGLHRLDANWLADEDGISRIAVSTASDGRGGFIPYTDRAIRWHTDGYYHPAERRIRGMILHCVRPAASGG